MHMPLQNRVAPDGELHAVSARGRFMGNRGGRIHDPVTQKLTNRTYTSRRWICCVTEFRQRQRLVWGNSYTELFFLDEVTALAAGHRPCFECRRKHAKLFAECWQKSLKLTKPPNADQMDKVLHEQRRQPVSCRPVVSLNEQWPDGTMIQAGHKFLTRKEGEWLRWSFDGYSSVALTNLHSQGQLITPEQIVAVLRAGYRPVWSNLIEITD